MSMIEKTATHGDRLHDGTYHALPDPVADRLFTVLMALAAEVWTVRDRVRLLESVLAAKGIETDALVEGLQGSDESLARMRADRDAFVERVLHSFAPSAPDASQP